MADNYNSTDPMDQSGEQEDFVDPELNQNFEEEGDDQAGFVDQREDDEGTGEGEGEEPDSGSATQNKRQTREDNAAARAARIRATREVQQKATAEALKAVNDRIAKLGIKNPYNDKTFSSLEEFEAYGEQVKNEQLKEEAEAAGISVEELSERKKDEAYTRKKRQEESEAEARKVKEAKEQGDIEADIMEFMESHPEVDAQTLITSELFVKFCGDRLGRVPLSDLYEDYSAIIGSARAGAPKKDDRGERSTGTGNTGGVVLTPKQKAELADWNRQFPEYKMTAKEFLKM